MPTWDKKTKTWTGNIQRVGYPRKVKKGFHTKSAAKEWERITFLNLKNPEKIGLTFAEASNKYLSWCEKRRKLNTYRQKAFIIRSAITTFQSDPYLKDITQKTIEAYLDHRFDKDGGKSANRDARELTTLFNWFIAREYCDNNPCKNLEKYDTVPFVKYVPPPEDINAVLLQANEFEYDYLQCIYHTAGRLSEIRRIKWDDIVFQTSVLTLWTRKRKGGQLEPDQLRMNTILQEILERRYRDRNKNSPWVFCNNDGNRVTKSTIDNIMPRLCKAAKVKRFGLHAIRHHVAAVMADSKKLSLIEIQKQLRQKRATTTDAYLKELVMGENTAADVLGKAQKKVFNTKINTIRHKKRVSD